MIDLINLNNTQPYNIFNDFYEKALIKNQRSIEAVFISTFNTLNNEVDSRAVNLKYIMDDEWVFFSNYESKKAEDFNNHSQISAIFYWSSINVQIRIKAKVRKSSREVSLNHYANRSPEKNALAVSSNQSMKIDSYEGVIDNYNKILLNSHLFSKLPDTWGGYSFTPYYFEFWQGHESRLNKRDEYKLSDGAWQHSFLQP